jgi:hypothetical protein
MYTEGVRMAFYDWYEAGQPSVMFVADYIEALIVGPIQAAFNAVSRSEH